MKFAKNPDLTKKIPGKSAANPFDKETIEADFPEGWVAVRNVR